MIDSSLAHALSKVYEQFLLSLVDEREARLFNRDFPISSQALIASIQIVGESGVYWRQGDEDCDADSTPYVIATINYKDFLLRFDLATEHEVVSKCLLNAENFRWTGAPIK